MRISVTYVGQHAHTVSLSSFDGEALHALVYPTGQIAGEIVVDKSLLPGQQLESNGLPRKTPVLVPDEVAHTSVTQDVGIAREVNIAKLL